MVPNRQGDGREGFRPGEGWVDGGRPGEGCGGSVSQGDGREGFRGLGFGWRVALPSSKELPGGWAGGTRFAFGVDYDGEGRTLATGVLFQVQGVPPCLQRHIRVGS